MNAVIDPTTDVRSCPSCGKALVRPFGRPLSPILLVGEKPDTEDLKVGTVWTSPAGDIMRSELRRAGINYAACRATTLWLHYMPTRKAERAICESFHIAQLFDMFKNAKAVLFFGAGLSQMFFNYQVTQINGVVLPSRILPDNIEVAMAAFSPNTVIAGSSVVGDFRFAVEQFGRATLSIRKEYHAGRSS